MTKANARSMKTSTKKRESIYKNKDHQKGRDAKENEKEKTANREDENSKFFLQRVEFCGKQCGAK